MVSSNALILLKRFFTSLFLVVLSHIGLAQITPVQVTPQLLPPYSLQVSDYYSGVQPKLQVMLLNRDINQPVIRVRLRMTVESQNCRMRTRPNAVTPVFTLTNGVPYYLTPQDLQAFFLASNLEIGGGYSEQQYVQTGRLPEGLYSIYFEAFEEVTGNLVSNKGFSLGWLTLAEPPILNTPARNEDVKPGTPQNIVFNWTPRHNTSVTAGYYTDYVFTIVEYLDSYMSPDAAFTANPPLFIDSVQNTTYLMGAAHPQLIPGRRYAWRVQAKSKDGSNQPVMFRNNGFSEVFVFNYRNNCNAPLGIISSINGQRASIEWQNDPMHLEWRVEYREKNNPKAEWFSLSNTLPRVLITDLKPGTQYEYRVGGACIAANFVYSPLGSFTTAGFNQNYMPGCGDTILPAPGSGNPRQTLVAGDSIQAGSFTVYVGYVTGTGSFSGQGYVIVPWLANAKVEVQFSNITVSEDKKLLTGEITTTYDPTESGIDDIDEYIDIFKAGMGVGDVITGLNQADTTFNFEIAGPGSINVVLPPSYNPQTGKGTEPISITVQPVPSSGPGGSTPSPAAYTVDSLPTTLKDAKDNVFKVNQDGQVVQIASGDGKSLLQNANTKKIDSDKGEVHFIDYPEKQKYAFDGWKEVYKKSSTFSKEYERLENYYVSQKAIAPSETDFIKAQVELKDSSINPRDIEFVSGTGVKYVKKALDSTYTLYEIEVIGGPGKDAQEIYALYKPAGSKTLNLGKIKVSSYPRVERKVYLVPINGFALNIDTVKKVLNGFFNKVNVHFSVIQESTYSNFEWDLNSDGRLDISSDKLFNVLSKEMILLNKFYRKDNDLDPNGLYIFLVRSQGDSKHENLVLGEMPKGKQFGYIFTNDEYSVDKDLKFSKVISHEVGHGAFALRHLFEYGELTEGESDLNNLMDYPLGANLLKAQWDFIHDPALSFGFLQDDLDIAYLDTLSDNGVLNIVTNGSTNFLSPSGELLTLPDKTVIYFYCLNYNILNGNGDGVPNGSVYGFKLPNGKEYTASINYETNIFNGYFEVINKGRVRDWKYNGSGASRQKIKYINTTTQDQGEKLISFLHLTRNGCNQSHSVWFLEQNFNFIPKPNNDFSLFYPNYLTNVEPVQDRVFDVGLKGCKDCTLQDVKAPKVLGGAKRRIDEQFFSYKEFLGSNETINMSPEDKLTLQEFFRALGSEFKLKFEVFIYPKNGTQSGLANDEYTTVRNQTGKKAIKIEVLEDGKLQIGDYQGVAERAVFDFDLWGFGIGNDCTAQYVQDKLAGTINENSVWLFCKKLYYGIKGVLVCKLGESNALLYDKTTQFVYGFAYEFIETIDVPEILNGLKDIGVAFAKFTLVEAPKMYIGLLKDIGSYAFQITLGGRNASIKDFLSFVIPQQFYAGFNSAKNAAKGLYSYFIENGNSWRYGQLTMISIPLVLTLGEYSAVIAVRLAKIYPIFAGLNSANKVKNICNILNRLTDLGSEIVLFGGVKVLAPIKDAYRYYGNIRNIDEATDALKQIENGVDPILDDASDFNKIEDFIDDANQFDNRVTFLDETESSIVSSGLSKVPFDGNLYIAIHGDKDFFEVISNGVSFKIDHRSLSTWIKKNNPSATNIVLLSCSDFNSAQNLANKLGDKKVIAWEGDVTVFESGAIQGEGRCREFSKSFDRNSFNFKELSGETVPAGLANAEKAGPSVSLGRRGRLTRGSDEIIVDNNGVTRFADELVEADYQYYLAFKRRQNRPPRDRADWKRASDYMKFDSPLARGNRFDDILRVEYRFTQIQIEDKFYLDALVPPSKGKKGQIISGKAIDLDAIDDRTFRKHCLELTTKYKKNSLITTKKGEYSEIKNTLLEGDYFLCLPDSNKNSPLLSDFEKIAKEYEIEIIFIAEGK